MSVKPPPISGILETVLYFTDQQRAESFYTDVLGLRLVGKEPGRSLFFRVGSGLLLLFDADTSRAGGSLPGHGARGPIHTCFAVPAPDYEAWKSYLPAKGVELLQETSWERGLSFYFHDSEGNLLEMANADIWPD